ncbi:hypothetical protein Rcae01_00673 [Novipirellula caenicola]|uniref:Uncharacterized protein n=1 Tax=Novipirellula caenicola TaxID=1536901 RepID=A0ABP9VJ42_9BACT
MDFLVRQGWIRRIRKSIVRLKQQAARDFRYGFQTEPGWIAVVCGFASHGDVHRRRGSAPPHYLATLEKRVVAALLNGGDLLPRVHSV